MSTAQPEPHVCLECDRLTFEELCHECRARRADSVLAGAPTTGSTGHRQAPSLWFELVENLKAVLGIGSAASGRPRRRSDPNAPREPQHRGAESGGPALPLVPGTSREPAAHRPQLRLHRGETEPASHTDDV
jgi:hypothetical protein